MLRPPLALLLSLSLVACSGARRASPTSEYASEDSTAESRRGCRPFFISPMNDEPERVPNHSCWNRAWEVPTAIVLVPVAIAVLVGIGTAPIWAPLLLR